MICITRRYRTIRKLIQVFEIALIFAFILLKGANYLHGNFWLWTQVTGVGFLTFLSLYSFRAFQLPQHKTWISLFTSILSGWTLGIMASTFILMIFDFRLSRYFYTMFALAILFIVLIVHSIFFFLLHRLIETENIIVIGKEENFSNIINQISSATGGKFIPVKYLQPEKSHILENLVDHPEVSTVIIADRGKINDPEVRELLSGFIDKDVNVRFLPPVAESTLLRIPLNLVKDFRRYYEISFISVEPETYQRAFDLLVSSISMVILVPVFIIIYLLVLVDSGFPVIFKQNRVGLFEKPFTLYKFRTMKVAPPDEGPAFLVGNGEERITKIGNFLRKTRLDEIPQLFNVLKGEMSIIGPRPEMKEFYEEGKKNIPFYRYRTRLRPGITGWAQVNFSHTTDIEDYKKKTEFDLYYIKNRSILLDLQIVLLTAEVMLGLKGAR